jgi:GTP-binding protein HflX
MRGILDVPESGFKSDFPALVRYCLRMNRTPKAILLSVQLPKISDLDHQASVNELKRLVDTLGYEVVGQLSQKRKSATSALVLGEGKLLELAQWTGGPGQVMPTVQRKKSKAAERFDEEEESNEELGAIDLIESEEEDFGEVSVVPDGVRADLVVFDGELSPSQLRNLEGATGVEVLDRTGVIIEIFSRHARTRAARLQVEIARLKYLAPRIRETGGASERQGGGVGGKGSGESSQELDRRHIRDRIKELKIELASVQSESSVRRNRRAEENSVALVGYTNAGKSSLMRAMTGSEILVADKLFATLDTTVRPLYPESQPKVLMSDTVGFIKKLPHDLVASFQSTLEEALNADLLLFVVDSSDPTFRQQLEVTRAVLAQINAAEIPSLLILNKRDRLSTDETQALRVEYPEAIQLSTRNKEDLSGLREVLLKFFEKDMIEIDLDVPYTVQGAIGEIRRQMRVVGETYTDKGVSLKVRAKSQDLARVKARFKL